MGAFVLRPRPWWVLKASWQRALGDGLLPSEVNHPSMTVRGLKDEGCKGLFEAGQCRSFTQFDALPHAVTGM